MIGRTIAAAVLAGAAALTAAMAPAAPAQASDALQCSANQHKLIYTPHSDVIIDLELCVERYDGDKRQAAIRFTQIQTTGAVNKPDALYFLHAHLRLERYDADIETVGCRQYVYTGSYKWWTYYAKYRGFHTNVPICRTAAHTGGSTGGWTADGVVYYDIKGDGKGTLSWPLHGSPMIN